MTKTENRQITLKIVYSAVFLALAMVLPFLTGQIPQIGKALSPLHIPTFLCGFLCGPVWGGVVGFVSPLMRSMIFGSPALFPDAVGMAFEMLTYGVVCGLMSRVLPRKVPFYYLSLITAMLCGRLVWGLARLVISGITANPFTLGMFWAKGFANAVPALILHIAVVPPIAILLDKTVKKL